MRDDVEVETVSGEKVTCMTYLANPFSVMGGLKPTRDYLKKILDAKEFFSEAYLEILEAVETID